MYLRKIQINGFKSFANPTEIMIDHHITGIVGPNGSGKSNIADAIRWVLGEQSSKSLRGAKMEDIIFNGTQQRQRKAFCEVSLIFDNQDGRIQCDYSEIVVTRKMYRSGESEYFINRAAVRLKDVLDLFRDTGIGKEGYSIIGQGKMDEILSSKPTARRKVFEEAAGITKFRTRKEEAEHKLEKTDENLVRVEDILEELKEQREPLRKQAEQTRAYLALFDRQRVLDVSLYFLNHARYHARLEKLQEEIQQLTQEIKERETQFSGAAKEAQQWAETLDQLSQTCETLSAEIADGMAEAERKTGQWNLGQEQAKHLQERLHQWEKECQEAEEKNAHLETEMGEKESVLAQMEEELQLLSKQVQAMEQDREKEQQSHAALEAQAEAANQSYLQLLGEISEKTSRLSALQGEEQAKAKQMQGLAQKLEEQKETQKKAQEIFAQMQKEAENRKAETKALSAQLNEGVLQRNQLQERQKESEQQLRDQENKLSQLRSRAKLLQDLKQEYDGYSDGVRNLMRAAKAKPEMAKGLLGTVAELISVPERYTTAIEATLKRAVQNVIVQTEEDARDMIAFLREKKMGRVTFMPIGALKENRLTPEERNCLSMPGCIAVASEVCSFDAKIAPAAEFLLGRTIIMDTLDHAIAVMRKGEYAFRTVTLDGDLMQSGGIMQGGSFGKQQFGLLSREAEIGKLARRIGEQEETLQKAKVQAKRAEEAFAQQKQICAELMDALKQAEIAAAKEREMLSGFARQMEQGHAMETQMAKEAQAAFGEKEALQQKKEALQESIAAMQQQARQKQSQAEALRENMKEDQDRVSEMGDELRRVHVLLAQKQTQWENRKKEFAQKQAQKQALAETMQRQEQAMQDLMGQMQEKETQLQAQKQAISQMEAGLAEKKAALAREEETKQQLNEKIRRHHAGSADYQMAQTASMERKYKCEAQVEKVQMALEAGETKLWEEYQLTHGAAEQYRGNFGYTEAAKEAQMVRQQIRELGPINPAAIEEFERMDARVSELDAQREDLRKAETDLQEVIQKLMQDMRQTFSQKFEEINGYFQEIFQDLFGGGRAELSMEQGDMMEAGIEITAEPPGKKLQQISLLSGGERAVTAIALLFAMLKINPSPICVLDEIDAPLDAGNVTRVGEYLRNIADSQFVIITHRKATMALCNILYGVAMEEKGVSKLVSVKIEEEKENVAS